MVELRGHILRLQHEDLPLGAGSRVCGEALERAEEVGEILGDPVLAAHPARGRRPFRASRLSIDLLPEGGLAKFQGLLGENLAAQHYVKQSGVDVEEFAQRFLDEWIKSQPHRDNLAFADYNRTGVGAAVNGDTVYVAQLFAFNLDSNADRDPNSGAIQFPDAESARSAASTASQEPLRLRGRAASTWPPAALGRGPQGSLGKAP